MDLVNKKRNEIWLKEDLKFRKLEEKAGIPNRRLSNVPFVKLKKESDLERVPDKRGCYWIWTNESINHSLHGNKTPNKFNDGEIIYNGVAKDDIRGRIRKHLFGTIDEGWSAISMDIYLKKSVSHRKKAMSRDKKKKTPFLKGDKIPKSLSGERISTKKLLLYLHLSPKERKYIKEKNYEEFFFRNGINIKEPKHRRFKFKVYFITELTSLSYLEYVEKKWRENNGLPKLCSYKKGR